VLSTVRHLLALLPAELCSVRCKDGGQVCAWAGRTLDENLAEVGRQLRAGKERAGDEEQESGGGEHGLKECGVDDWSQE
jgi:hypothetical protein